MPASVTEERPLTGTALASFQNFQALNAVRAQDVTTPPLTALNLIDSEVPAGTVDGVNKAFTLANTPAAGSLHVYADGARTTAYTLSVNIITFAVAPTTSVLCDYRV